MKIKYIIIIFCIILVLIPNFALATNTSKTSNLKDMTVSAGKTVTNTIWKILKIVLEKITNIFSRIDVPKIETGKIEKTTINLSYTSLNIDVGGSKTITATVNPSGTEVTWTSSNTKVATVKNGIVTGLTAGNSTITATSNGVSATCSVTVKNNSASKITEMINLAKSLDGKSLNSCKTTFENKGISYPNYSGGWCSWFVYTLYKNYGFTDLGWNGFSFADKWRTLNDGRYHKKSSGYTPQAGDLALFDYGGDGAADHVAIIVNYQNANSITVVDGNIYDKVRVGNLPTSNKYLTITGNIIGYYSVNK